MNIALTEDLQRLLRKKVENGQFSNEEAVVKEALRLFLIEEPENRQSPTISTGPNQPNEDGDAKPSRGIYALEFPEKALFTKQIDIRPEQLEEWHPQGVTSERRTGNEDE